ncbi:MAG: hypothetical protein H8E43_02155 [Planctomycetia bacterium]|nr:hypothetical protein [Planctomycetia bacterium]MBL6915204.1 hypothetical protein [Planctomycetota bacterium]HCW44161.1 hypothetical protein [Planctomycetota bacterium]
MKHQLSIIALLLFVTFPGSDLSAQEGSSRIGLGDYGQTSILDNRFNPALSFIGDFVATWSDDEGIEAGADGFKLRGAEIGLFGAVDDAYEFHGILFFDEEEVELEEAYVLATDWLTPTTHIKAGRFNMDFGKLSPIHDGELPTLDKPSVLQEYIGGTLRGTGAEVHWWSPIGDASLLRGSLGIFQSAESDSHVILGPGGGHHGHGEEEDEDEEGPLRETGDFAINARLSSLFDISDTATVQLGGSLLTAPERVFGVDEDDIQNVDKSVMGLDITLVSTNESNGSGYRFQAEALINDQDSGELDEGDPAVEGDEIFNITNQEATGFYFMAERTVDSNNTIGLSYNQYEHAEDSDEESSDFGVYYTKKLNEFNRLRFEIRSFKDLALEEDGVEELVDFTAVSVQWTVQLGSHGHGLEW